MFDISFSEKSQFNLLALLAIFFGSVIVSAVVINQTVSNSNETNAHAIPDGFVEEIVEKIVNNSIEEEVGVNEGEDANENNEAVGAGFSDITGLAISDETEGNSTEEPSLNESVDETIFDSELANETSEHIETNISEPFGENRTTAEPINETIVELQEPSLLKTAMDLIANKVSAIAGEIVNLKSYLLYENETPIADKPVDFFADELQIGTDVTDNSGLAEIDWDTSNMSPRTYTISADYEGDDIFEGSDDDVELEISAVQEANMSETNISEPIQDLTPTNESIPDNITDEIQPTVTFTDKHKKSAGNSLLTKRKDGKFDLDLEKGLNTKVEIKGFSRNITAKIDSITNSLIKTEVAAFGSIEFEEAVITLPKYGEVNTILYCQDFDIELFNCEEWIKTDIPFTQTEDTITFTVTHFTAYAGGGSDNSSLMIWDETDPEVGYTRYINDTVQFFTNYSGTASGNSINGTEVYCEIKFNVTGSWTSIVNMTFNSTSNLYEYNRTFNQNGIFDWNVLCDGSPLGYELLNATDNVTISYEYATIQLKSPFNNKIDLDGNINFAYNVTDSTEEIANCSLIFDEKINQTDLTVNKSIIQYFSLNDAPNGDYNWSINCTNEAGDGISSEILTINVFIDVTAPTVTLNGPVDNSEDSDGNVIFNYTVNDDNWVTNCNLYTDISGIWQINRTNIFVQKNTSLYFTIDNIADDTTFSWNIVCYDFALSPNFDWSDANWTLTINNSAPTYLSIPNQSWQEDSYTTLNLSEYFLDPDGDTLNYNSTSPDNITLSVDNEDGIVIIKPDINWYGTGSITFYASDPLGENTSSNTVILTVNEAGDTPPNHIFTYPANNYNDTDGFITFTCNSTDDYGLDKIEFYLNTTGTWHMNQTKNVSGITNSTTFLLANLTDGLYTWACKFYDNSNQSSWSENRTFSVGITAEIEHDIRSFTINHVDHNRTIAVSYSSYLNDSLTLGNLTFYLSNGTIYFNKNMSTSSGFEVNSTNPPIIVRYEKIRMKYDEIFYGNFTVGNEEWLNITLEYYYQGNTYQTSTKQTIEIKSSLPVP